MRRTWALLRKEVLHIVRDRKSLITAILNPLLLLFVYGFGISTDIKDVKLGVVDWSKTQQSRALVTAFTSSGYFVRTLTTDKYDELGKAVDGRKVQVGIVIPVDFARNDVAGKPNSVQVILDGSDPNTANSVSGYASSIIATFSQDALTASMIRRGVPVGSNPVPIDLRPRIWYNEDLLSIFFIVPGVVVIVLMTTTASLIAGSVTRERERGSIEQIVASPVTATELMVGKTIAYIGLAFIDVIVVVVAAELMFHVPFRGSLLLFGATSLIFIISSLGLGLIASAGAQTQRAAMTTVMMVTMLPSFILSGFVFPISSMPAAVQPFTYLVPARYFMVIARGLFLKGVGFTELWSEIWPMSLLATILLGASIATFKKKI